MSTEHQKYSIINQLSAITQYAVLHDIDIARVYKDDGRSGLTLRGRPALRRLFDDIA
jgi:DNA invertase Pin-like site-specific DNA recombinase